MKHCPLCNDRLIENKVELNPATWAETYIIATCSRTIVLPSGKVFPHYKYDCGIDASIVYIMPYKIITQLDDISLSQKKSSHIFKLLDDYDQLPSFAYPYVPPHKRMFRRILNCPEIVITEENKLRERLKVLLTFS